MARTAKHEYPVLDERALDRGERVVGELPREVHAFDHGTEIA